MTERIVSARPRDEDLLLDRSLRPRGLDEFIGQDRIKDNLRIAIAAKGRCKPSPASS